MKKTIIIACFLLCSFTNLHLYASVDNSTAGTALDAVVFGNTASETAHNLVSNNTQIISGALGQSARQCLPFASPGINGGDFSFTITIHPVKRNYITVKFWGGDEENRPSNSNMGRIYLYAPLNGVNYSVAGRHESDYTALALDGQLKAPLPGRFFYSTTLLPLWMTKGKTSITLKIVSTGRLYGLGSGIAPSGNYQYLMDYPSRGIYKAFSHTEPMLDVSEEVNGSSPAVNENLTFAGEGVLNNGGAFFNAVRNRINNRLSTAVSGSNFTTPDVQYLAKSYFLQDLPGYQNPNVIKKVVELIDAYTNDYYANNNAVSGEWGGLFGPLGYAVYLLRDELTNWMDVTVGYNGGLKTRREAWGDMLAASRDYGRMNRRTITNQTLIGDGHLYKANKGLLALGDSRAFDEEEAQRYLKEAVGLLPWMGNDLSDGGSAKPYDSNFYMVTPKGLTRERGYLGVSYGEMASHAAEFYKITGNEEFRKQAIKMVNARVNFRRPAIQKTGSSYYWAMEGVGLLAWRGVRESDGEFANEVAYGDRYGYTGGLYCAAATGDPDLMAYAQQMVDEKQLFASFSELDGRNHLHLDIFADYQIFKAAQKSNIKIPMSDGEPDFVWADEDIAIVAMKQGENRLWVSPFWQNKEGINAVARFHYSTPTYDQIGLLETYPCFQNSGTYTTRGQSIDIIASSNLPDNPRHAYAGELLPIPASELVSTGSALAGYMPADFYAFRFGNYLFGINTGHTKTAELRIPVGSPSGTELISNTTVSGNTVPVAPKTTKVIRLMSNIDLYQLPTPPLMAYIASRTSTTAVLRWTEASGAETYTVKGAATSGGPYTIIASGLTGTSHTINDITQNSYFVIHGVNAHGESYPSSEVPLAYSSNLPVITGSLTASGKVGAHFTYSIAALYSPSSFGATGLPEGLTINTRSGQISGTPVTAGDYTVSITAQNPAGSATETLALNIQAATPPRITGKLTLTAYRDVPFGYKIEASNHPVSFSADNLPDDFQIDTQTGMIKGSFTANGSYAFSVKAINTAGEDAQTVNVTVTTPPAPEITNAASATALLNEDFKFYIVATYAPTNYAAESLPPGFSIDPSTGCISGKAMQSGVFSVAVSATNAGGTGRATLSITTPATAPVPWVSQDIYPVGVEITQGYNAYNASTQTFTVNGAGNDIGSSNDSFHFLYCPINSSNITFIARLASRTNGGGADKVGVMIRESTASNSRHVFLNIDFQQKQIRFPFRANTGGGTDYTQSTTTNGNTVPIWFKLERSGNTFTGHMSLNGTVWTQVGAASVAMPQNVLAGMAVCSRNVNLNTSSFSNVSIWQGTSLSNINGNVFRIYPSLVEDFIQIECDHLPFEQGNLTVADVSGRIVLNQKVESKHNQIDMQNLHSGMYILTVAGKSGVWVSTRVMKK